jgi:hypothetical protein
MTAVVILIWTGGWVALGIAGGFAVGWTAREHQIERRIRRNALPPAKLKRRNPG